MNRRMLFFVNPNAGKTEIRAQLLDVLATFAAGGYRIIIHPTSHAREITEVTAGEGADYDIIVSCGGDGTLNETVNGLMRLPVDRRPLLGYIPAGTVNDFATSLRIPKLIPEAADAIVSGRPYVCDLGRFGDTYFSYVAAFGAFTRVSYATPREEKQVLGRAAYLLEGIRSLNEIRPYHVRVEHDGIVTEDDVILGMITNATSVGGFKSLVAQAALMNDGLSEVVLVRAVKSLTDLNGLANSVLRWDINPEQFIWFQTDRVRIEFEEEVPWTVDGEFGGSVREAVVENIPAAMRIMVPRGVMMPSLMD